MKCLVEFPLEQGSGTIFVEIEDMVPVRGRVPVTRPEKAIEVQKKLR